MLLSALVTAQSTWADAIFPPLAALLAVQAELVPVPLPVSRTVAVEHLTQWLCAECGAECLVEKSCRLVADGEQVRVIALKDLEAEDLFIQIPRRLIMSSETALASPAGTSPGRLFHASSSRDFVSGICSLHLTLRSHRLSAVHPGPFYRADALCQSSPSVVLSLHLWAEKHKGPASFWAPYIAALPSSAALPFSFSLEHLRLLQGSMAYRSALALLHSTVRQYLYFLHTKHAGVVPFLWRDWAWCVSIVLSRQNQIPDAKYQGAAMALVPGWDMANHSPKVPTITTSFDTEVPCRDPSCLDVDHSHDDDGGYSGDALASQLDCLACWTVERVTAGSECHIYYGDRPNLHLFAFQGFSVEHTPRDSARAMLSLDESDPLFKMKKLLANKRGFQAEEVSSELTPWCVCPELE
jgi:hypothetical protein